jgi:hypothetical protein
MHDNATNKDNIGKCSGCVSCLERTWTRWIKLKTYVRDTVEFAENGKIHLYITTKKHYITKDIFFINISLCFSNW